MGINNISYKSKNISSELKYQLYWKHDKDIKFDSNNTAYPRKCIININTTYNISFEITGKQGKYTNFYVRSLNSFDLFYKNYT